MYQIRTIDQVFIPSKHHLRKLKGQIFNKESKMGEEFRDKMNSIHPG